MQLKTFYNSAQKTPLFIRKNTFLYNFTSNDKISSLGPTREKIKIKKGFLDRLQRSLYLNSNQLQNGVRSVGLSKAQWTSFHTMVPVGRSQRIGDNGCIKITLPHGWVDYSEILVSFILTCFKNSCLKYLSKILRTKPHELLWRLLVNCLKLDQEENFNKKQVLQSSNHESYQSQALDFQIQSEATRIPKLNESSIK